MTTSNSMHVDKDLMRERARQERALQAQQLQDADSPFSAPLFGEPRKRTPSAEDSTHQQIKKVLGEYDQVQPYVTHLVGIGKVPVTPLPGQGATAPGPGFTYPQNTAVPRPTHNGATFKSTSKVSAKEVTKHIAAVSQQDNASGKSVQEKHRTSGKKRLSESGRSVDLNSSSSHGKSDLSEKGSTHSHRSTSGSSHSHKSHSSKSGKHSVKITDTNSVKPKEPNPVKDVMPPAGGLRNEKALSETVLTSLSSSASKTVIQDSGISREKSPTPKPSSKLSSISPHQLVGSMKNLPNGVTVNGHVKKANHSRSGNVLNILMPSETENKPFSEDPKELADILKEMTCLEAPLTAIHSPRKEEKFFSSNSIANTKPYRKPSNLVNNVDDLPRKENKLKTKDGNESAADENDSESEDEAVQEPTKSIGGKHAAGRARKSPSRTSCMSSASSSSASGSSSESSSEDESSSEEEKDEPEETTPPPVAPPPTSVAASQAETQKSAVSWELKNFKPVSLSSSKPSEDRGMRISFSTDDEVEVIKPERSKHKPEHKRKPSSTANNNKSPVRSKLNSSSKDASKKSSKSPSWKLGRKSDATDMTHETTPQSSNFGKGRDMSGSSNKSTSGDKGRNGESSAGNTPTGRWKKSKAITPDIVSDVVSSDLEIDVVTVSPEKSALNVLKTAKSHLSQRLEFDAQDKVVVSNTEERRKESKSGTSSHKSNDNVSGSAKNKDGSCDKNKTVVDNGGKIKKSGRARSDRDLEHIMDSVISPHLDLLSPIPNVLEICPSLPASWLRPTTTRENGKLSLVVKLNLALIDSLPRNDNGNNNADDTFKTENISRCLPEKQVTNVILDSKISVEELALLELTPENITVKKEPDKKSSTPDKSVFNKDVHVKSEPDTGSGDAPCKEDTPTSVVDSKSLIRNQLFGEATPPDITKNIPKRKLEMDRQDDTKRHKSSSSSKSSTPTKRKPEPGKEKVKVEDEKESTHRKHTKRLSERRGSGGSSSSQKGGSKRSHAREEKGTAHASKTNNSEEPLQNGVGNHRPDNHLSSNEPISVKSEVLHNRTLPPEEKVENPAVHLSAAQKLKHQADGMTDRLAKLSTYTEAVLSFILYGYALEKDHLSDASKMYRETHDLIIYISKLRANQPEASLSISDKILSVLSLRIQSLLCLKLFKLRKSDALKLKRIVDDHNKSNKPVAHHHAPSPHQMGLTNHSTGAPSPMSPTPSPSGSIGSQGSCDLAVPKITNGNPPSAVPKAPPGTINIPMRIHSVTQKYLKDVGFLVVCHDLWEQADTASLECNDFFTNLDDVCGPLSLHTNVPDLVRFIRKGLATLSSNT